jgi:nicotinamidase-related amidase
MPISVLDAKPALVVIDLRKGIVGMPTAHPMAGVIQNSVALVEAFRRHRLPVVLVNVDGVPAGRAERSFSIGQMPAGWTDLIGELNR